MIPRDYLIIGAGMGGATVCETIREFDQKGSITLVGNEPFAPYHREQLLHSILTDKDASSGGPSTAALEKITHPAPEWYAKNNVELRLNTLVTQFNLERRLAVLSTGQVIEFRKACLAMGSRPRRPALAGVHLGNVLTLRTVKDALALREIAPTEKLTVVVGSDFTAVAAAVAVRGLGANVQLMTPHRSVLNEALDPETASWLTQFLHEKGISLIHESLNGFEGKTVLRSISTKSGTRIPAGLAILCAGMDVNLGLVANTPLSSPQGCPVNEYLETDEKGIYAVGDLALYPDLVFGGARRTDFPENTLEQARIAGGNITGRKRQKYRAIPRHRHIVFDLEFEFLGDFSQPARCEVEGDRAKRQFVVRHFQGNKLKGVLLCNQEPERVEAAKAELLAAHQ